MDKRVIIDFLKEHKSYLESRFKVKSIALFGSYADNTQTDKSDIDLIVDMPSDFDLYYDLKEYLEESFNKSVDLALHKTLRSLIKEKIRDELIYV